MTVCLIVQHVPPERPYAFGDALADLGVDLLTCAVHDRDAVPSDAAGLDGLIVMGGPMSAADDGGFPTRRAEMALLADAVRRGVPTIGVCLGAQLLAGATGGRVEPGRAGPEIGWGTVDLTSEADGDPLFGGLGTSVGVLHWHGDTFTLPAGAVRLASSDRYPNQAFRLGGCAWGLQFHIEVDRAAVSAFVSAFGDEAAAAGTDPARIEAGASGGAPGEPGGHGRLVAHRFASVVATAGAPLSSPLAGPAAAPEG